ncbi:MAG: hypothetical protein R2788_06060 [Saprospiraceae bacterium]
MKYADAPAAQDATPSGFFSEEACQISRYAGMNDKLTSIGFYELTKPNWTKMETLTKQLRK